MDDILSATLSETPISPSAMKNHVNSFFVFLLLWFAVYNVAFTRVDKTVGVDFYNFWAVSQYIKSGHTGNIYTVTTQDKIYAFCRKMVPDKMSMPAKLYTMSHRVLDKDLFVLTSTPFLYATVDKFIKPADHSYLNRYDSDLYHFSAFSTLLLVLSLLMLFYLAGYGTVTALLGTSLLLCWYLPIEISVRAANATEIQLFLIAAYLICLRGKNTWLHILCGLTLGLMVMSKPNMAFIPLLLGFSWITSGRWRIFGIQASSAIVSALAAFAVGSIYLGSWHAWIDWFKILPVLSIVKMQKGNYCISSVVQYLYGVQIYYYVLALTILLSAWYIWKSRNNASFRRDYLIVCLGMVIGLTGLQLVWLHYYVLFIPLLIYMFRPDSEISKVDMLTSVFVFLFLCSGPIVSIVSIDKWQVMYAMTFVVSGWELMFLGLKYLKSTEVGA
jgi:hypothetical protein